MVAVRTEADGRTFEASAEALALCETIAGLWDVGLGVEVVPVVEVRGREMERVLAFCEEHVSSPADAPARAARALDALVDPEEACALICAADRLNCEPLFDGLCRALAHGLRGKDAAQLRRELQLPNDMDPGVARRLALQFPDVERA